MAKSSSTPIEFGPKLFFGCAVLAGVLAIVSFFFVLHGILFGLFSAVFWAVVAVMCVRRGLRGPTP
jgi:membrane protein required for beta-lactamase induction